MTLTPIIDIFTLLFKQILYINYLIYFKKDSIKMQGPLHFCNKVNTIILAYVLKLALKIYLTNIKAQKIDGISLKIFEIVVASFQVNNIFGRF